MDVFPPGCCHGLTRRAKTHATKEGLVCAVVAPPNPQPRRRGGGEEEEDFRKTSGDSGVTQVAGFLRVNKGQRERWTGKNTPRCSSRWSGDLVVGLQLTKNIGGKHKAD